MHLNNIFLNPFIEKIRKTIFVKTPRKQLGTKEALKYFKQGTSIALMIDQRVSEGIKCKLFDIDASTTTIPAQFLKKYNCKIVPIYIQRKDKYQFKMEIFNPVNFPDNSNIENITSNLNKILEDMIKKNPDQWIWTHNRWR